MFDVNEVEDRLVKAAEAGELLDVSKEPDRDVRAVVIRDLLWGTQAKRLDPRGVRLRGAHIVGALDLTDICAPVPLVLTACDHDNPVTLKRAHLPHLDLSDSTLFEILADDFVCDHDVDLTGIRGQVLSLIDGKITGQLDLRDATLTASDGPALMADRVDVGGSMFLRRGFQASSDSGRGTLRLHNASVSGVLDLSGATLTASNGPALSADRLKVGAAMFLRNGFQASSDSSRGALSLAHASVTGELDLSGATLTASNGPALNADGLMVAHGLRLRGVHASSDSSQGTLSLVSATINDVLNLNGATLTASNGPALSADRLNVGGSMHLQEGFQASSDSSSGTLSLPGASINGVLSLIGATLTASNGPALRANSLNVTRDVFLRSGFQASSDSSSGTLSLPGATINGQFVLVGSQIRNTGKIGLVMDVGGSTVKGAIRIPLDAFCSAGDVPFRIGLGGFSYPFVPRDANCQEWLGLLVNHTPTYAADPYQQLASVYRAAGHDRDVRRILIAQQIDHRRRGDLGNCAQKLLHRANGLFIGHGHRPWRALIFLAGVCALAVGVAVAASLLGLTVHPNPPGRPCSTAEAIGLAVDTTIPVFKLGGQKQCEIAATTTWGQVLYLTNYLLRALGWAFATLFIAGYTGLIRNTT